MDLNKEFLEKYNDLMNEDVELALEFSLNALKEVTMQISMLILLIVICH